MNLFIGFEQANNYTIMNSSGQPIGFMREKDIGFGRTLGRQFFRLHRPFDIDVFNMQGELALSIKRPFSFINSHIKALLPGYDHNNEIMYEIVGKVYKDGIYGDGNIICLNWRMKRLMIMSNLEILMRHFCRLISQSRMNMVKLLPALIETGLVWVEKCLPIPVFISRDSIHKVSKGWKVTMAILVPVVLQ